MVQDRTVNPRQHMAAQDGYHRVLHVQSRGECIPFGVGEDEGEEEARRHFEHEYGRGEPVDDIHDQWSHPDEIPWPGGWEAGDDASGWHREAGAAETQLPGTTRQKAVPAQHGMELVGAINRTIRAITAVFATVMLLGALAACQPNGSKQQVNPCDANKAAQDLTEPALHYNDLAVEVVDAHGVSQTWPVTETIQFLATDGTVIVFCDANGNVGGDKDITPEVTPYTKRVQWYDPVVGAAIKIDAYGVKPGWAVDCATRNAAGGPVDYQPSIAPEDRDGTFALTVTCQARGL